jgi:hypothetical protein
MRNGTKNGTRRTTLTLPVKALAAAERVAHARKVSLSAVISEAVEKSLHADAEDEQEGELRVQAWEAHRQSFARLTKEEQQALSGIFMDEQVEE